MCVCGGGDVGGVSGAANVHTKLKISPGGGKCPGGLTSGDSVDLDQTARKCRFALV